MGDEDLQREFSSSSKIVNSLDSTIFTRALQLLRNKKVHSDINISKNK